MEPDFRYQARADRAMDHAMDYTRRADRAEADAASYFRRAANILWRPNSEPVQ